MKLFLLLAISFGFTSQLYAKNCNSEYPQDLLFCNSDLTYSVDVIQSQELDELITGIPQKNTQKIYIEESIRHIADKIGDERFNYEGNPSTGTVDFYSPREGYFEVVNVWLDNQEFTFVQWHDLSNSSYTLLFENPDSFKLVYIQLEN